MSYAIFVKRVLYLFLVATLTACQLPELPSEPSPERKARDRAFWECNYESRAATADIADEDEASVKQANLFEDCMKAKGYDY